MDETNEIDVKELFRLFRSKLWLIIPLFIAGCIFGAIYAKFIVTPMYSASTTLVLSKPVNMTPDGQIIQDSISQTDLSINSRLISTYGEIIKKRKILGRVIDNLQLEILEKDLVKNISVNAVKDTDVMEVTVMDKDPEQATRIANEIAKVFSQEIVKIYNIQNVSIIDEAEVTYRPINVHILRDSALFGIITLIVVMTILFFIYYFDTTIKSTDDIEKYIGLPVLAVIPNVNTFEAGGKSHGRK